MKSGATFYYSSNNDPEHRNGVGFKLTNQVNKSVRNVVAVSDQIMLLQLDAKPININLIQVYAPTSERPDGDAERFYEQIQEVLSSLKSQEIIIVIGDFNPKIGRGAVPRIAGGLGLGDRNERGDMLIQFCCESNFVIKNTFYKLHPRRFYTWKSPGDAYRNQTDYFLINQRFQNSITHVVLYPGADIGFDNSPPIADFRFLCKLLKKSNLTSGN